MNKVVPLHMNVFPRISTSHFIVRLEEDFWNVRFQWWWDYLKKKNGVTEKAKEKKMVLPSDNSCCFSNSDLTPEDYKQRMRHWKKNNATAKLSMFCSQKKKYSSYCCLTKKFCQKQKKKILYFYLLLAFLKKKRANVEVCWRWKNLPVNFFWEVWNFNFVSSEKILTLTKKKKETEKKQAKYFF